jgi:hypothetical protein
MQINITLVVALQKELPVMLSMRRTGSRPEMPDISRDLTVGQRAFQRGISKVVTQFPGYNNFLVE